MLSVKATAQLATDRSFVFWKTPAWIHLRIGTKWKNKAVLSLFSRYLPLLFQSRCEKPTHIQIAYLSQPGRASTRNEPFWCFSPIVPLAELLNHKERKGGKAHIAFSGLFCIMRQNLVAEALVLTGMATAYRNSDFKILLLRLNI